MLKAQDTINLPPDYYGEELRRGYAAWKNTGWVRNTDGDPVPDVEYVTDGATPRAFIRKNGAMSLVLASIDTSITTMDTLRRLDIAFDGSLAQYPDPIAQEEEGYLKNFHLPWCGPGGKTEVPGYHWIMYPEIYPKIDMYIYCGSRGQKLMFVVRPEGDPANLKMTLSGHDDMEIDVLGNLRMLLQERWVVLPEAIAYQYDGNNDIWPVSWTAEYTADTVTGEVGFTFDEYDRYKPLVLLIGPPPLQGGPSIFTNGVCWSTYYGGDEDDFIFASRIDGLGSYYVTGQSFSSSSSFPIEDGTVYYEASPTVTVARFDDSDQLLWSTYFGASMDVQYATSLAIPSIGGSVFIGGRIDGNDIAVPVTQPAGRFVDLTPAYARDGFLASFFAESGELEWSTYFGGDFATVNNIDFDAIGNLYVCGESTADLPLPTELTPPEGSESWENSGEHDAFVCKLSQLFKVAWSTYIGGSGIDKAFSVRVGAGKIVVAGSTQSASFQTMTAGGSSAHNYSSSSYSNDIFIVEFNASCVEQWGSYFSYGGLLGRQGLALDKNNGDIFLAGDFLTSQSSMPVSSDAPWYQSPNSSVLEKGFIWQLGSDHVRKYSTYITGTDFSNYLNAVEVDANGQIYAGGVSWATSMSTACAGDLYCATEPQGYGDAYVIVLTPEHWRSWLTYFGGNSDFGSHAEEIRTVALKGTDRLYVAGHTYSPYDEQADLFFPLHDELGGAWWDSELDAEAGSDAFVTAFCIEDMLTGFTGITEADELAPILIAYFNMLGSIEVVAAGGGRHLAQVFDTSGRLVVEHRFQVGSNGLGRFDPGWLPQGVYLVRIDGITCRLIATR